jgi:hypothetical protein
MGAPGDRESWSEGNIMSELGGASTWQCAVIAIRTQPPEQLVIAYPDENTLRTIIAVSSIIALGYDSADQAVADIDWHIPMTVASRRRSTKVVVTANGKPSEEVRAVARRFADPYGLRWPQSFLGHVLQHSVAAAIVLFYSKNILSATLRAFISSWSRDQKHFKAWVRRKHREAVFLRSTKTLPCPLQNID